MAYRKYHHNNSSPEKHGSSSTSLKRFFFWPFKRKEKMSGRKGALRPLEVKRIINDSAKFDVGNDIRISPALLRFLYKYNPAKVMMKTSHIHLRRLKY